MSKTHFLFAILSITAFTWFARAEGNGPQKRICQIKVVESEAPTSIFSLEITLSPGNKSVDQVVMTRELKELDELDEETMIKREGDLTVVTNYSEKSKAALPAPSLSREKSTVELLLSYYRVQGEKTRADLKVEGAVDQLGFQSKTVATKGVLAIHGKDKKESLYHIPVKAFFFGNCFKD